MPGQRERLDSLLSDRYEILEEIGQGGTAVVYLARDLKHNREVAVKVLRRELTSVVDIQRFDREVTIASSFSHPHILPIYDSGRVEELVYYVMPRVDGETLRERLDRMGSLPLSEVLDLALDVSAALDYAHRHGVVHRDVKPENVFITDGEALLSDFGLAVDLDSTRSKATATGLSIGTPRYMSPEQLMTPDRVDWRSDVFCFGVLLFEAVTGHLPFGSDRQGSHPLAWLAREPGDLGPKCPRRLAAFIYSCLELELNKRGPRGRSLSEECRAVAEDLAHTHSGRPLPYGGPRLWWGAIISAAVVSAAVIIVWPEPVPTFGPVASHTPVVTWATDEAEGRHVPGRNEISFLSDRDGAGNVWVVSLDSGGERQVTRETERVVSHLWSPEGDRFAYVIVRDGRYLRLADREGTTIRTLRLPPGGGSPHLVRWFGDTIYLLLSGELWSVDLTTEEARQLTRELEPTAIDVRADERRIVFATGGDQSDLRVADLDGGNVEPLIEDESLQLSPCWLDPRGEEIVYRSNEGGQMGAWRISVASRIRRPVTTGFGGVAGIDCAPDGSGLLLEREERRADLWLWNPSDERHMRLTADTRADLMVSGTADGRVAFQRDKPQREVDYPLWDGTIMTGVLRDSVLGDVHVLSPDGFSPTVSPKGEWVSFFKYPSRSGGSLPDLHVADQNGNAYPIAEDFRAPRFRYDPPLGWQTHNAVWSSVGPSLFYIETTGDGEAQLARALLGPEGPVSETIRTFGPQEEPMDLAVSPSGELLAYLVLVHMRGERQLRLLETARGGAERTLHREPSASELYNVGWLSDAGPIVVVRARDPVSGIGRAEPLLVSLDGGVVAVEPLEAAYGWQMRLQASTASLISPAIGDAGLGLFELGLHDDVGWTMRLGGFPFSSFQVLADGRLLYARHDLRSDIWRVVFDDP